MSKRALAAAARLRDPLERRVRGETLLEGPRLVAEALAAGVSLAQVFATDEDEFDRAAFEAAGAEVIEVGRAGLERVATTPHPKGPVAVMSIPPVSPATDGPSVVMAGLADPGNLGTLIRSAAAFGWNVICAGDGADPWSPKVMRAAAGGHFRSPPELLPELDLPLLRVRGYTPAAAVVNGGLAPDQLPSHRWALLIGHEARGLDPQWAEGADFRVTIPMASGSESLNAGVAGSLLMYAMASGRPQPHH
ncbi:MAG TPA: RNA methyltransferase [Acidimicrobiia bacterium]